ILEGKAFGLIFEKPSTRTYVSFDIAINDLGGHSVTLPVTSLGNRESIYDIAKTMERYVDGLIIRTFKQQTLEDFARYFSKPVINALSDKFHPCQIMADYQTIVEKKGKKKVKIAYLGDGFNVANCLTILSSTVGYDIHLGMPKGYEPSAEILALAKKNALKSGSSIVVSHDAKAVAEDADVLYTDTWIPMGKEAEENKRIKVFQPFQLNTTILKKAKKDAIVMHCLPAHRGQEITDEVIDGKQSVVFDEAENRLHIQKAILTYLYS
ncbi:MAG: ornithine carbamoyltransferase, partial [Candidatus Margulisbacteria bacterium]|nr:ornithine carbamoyltransferase [Candidatus Margulisiibacteriota bacterium]